MNRVIQNLISLETMKDVIVFAAYNFVLSTQNAHTQGHNNLSTLILTVLPVNANTIEVK